MTNESPQMSQPDFRPHDEVARVDVLMALTHEIGDEPEVLAELYELIERSPAARSRYIESVELRTSLRTILDPSSAMPAPSLPTAGSRRVWNALIATASIAAVAFFAVFFGRPNSRPDETAMIAERSVVVEKSGAAEDDGVVQPKPRVVCARVDAMSLGITEDIFAPDYLVRDGDVVRLGDSHEGWVRFRTETGATLLLTAPALGHFESPSVFVLNSGQLIGEDRSKSPEKLSVRVGDRLVSDLGTRFGISVSDNDRLDVEVFDGAVSVASGNEQVVDQLTYGTGLTWLPGKQEPRIQPLADKPMLGRLNQMVSGVTATDGDVRFHSIIPESVAGSSGGRDPVIHVFEEQLSRQLDQQVRVSQTFSNGDLGEIDVICGGETTRSEPFGRALGAQRVRTFLLHFEDASGTRASGFVEFDRPILAVISDASLLAETDGEFARSGVTYPSGDGTKTRGMESDPSNAEPAWRDKITVSHGRTRVNVSLIVGHGVDQMRILVADE